MKLGSATLALGLLACGDDGSGTTPDAVLSHDAVPDSPAGGLPTTCTGDCQVTALTATFQATRTLNLAYYGVTRSASGATLHVEAYAGAPPRCPMQSDPPPDYTLILGTVPIPATSDPVTSNGNVLDFKGDLLGGDLGRAATSVSLIPVAANVCESCQTDPDGMIALDATLSFEDGTVNGHLYAAHCDSMDSTQ